MRPRLSALVLATLGTAFATGCYTEDPRAGHRPPQNGVVESGPVQQPFDPRLVDPKFEAAVADYWRDLRTLGWDANENEIRRSVRLLAIAAERVPYTGSVDVAAVAARVRTASVGGLEAPLQELSRVFIALAQGPYREGVGVLGAAYGFEQAVRAMTAARARGFDRRTAFDVLGRGEQVLWSIRGAVGRGEVGLVSSGPPPAEFE